MDTPHSSAAPDLTASGCSERVAATMRDEHLLPPGLLARLHARHPEHSDLFPDRPLWFTDRNGYGGLDGLRAVAAILHEHGVDLGAELERELFVDVYRFLATRYLLNRIDWQHFEDDSYFHLVFPQPGMFPAALVDAYAAAGSREARAAVAASYLRQTNPHDGHQLLNKPWFRDDEGELEVVHGSQHKYPQVQLLFDQSTQHCFAFCTYCFRHAQVRGDDDMFLQRDIDQVHRYLCAHPEVTDILITGGDAGYLQPERFERYIEPLLSDPALFHVKTVRLGSRVLSYEPERVLSPAYDRTLSLFDRLYDHGIQVAFMAHFSTPREVMHPLPIAAIRRLQAHHAVVRSQSPMIKHVSMFAGPDGCIDVERSARNWIDLADILSSLSVGFHSIYVPRPTGQWQYFTAPLAEISPVYDQIYRSLPSLDRPGRHISMTTSAGKISILGTAIVRGEKVFALKFSEGRDMAWLDRVFLARYDRTTNNVALLQPYDTDRFFFEDDLVAIEASLAQVLEGPDAGASPAPVG